MNGLPSTASALVPAIVVEIGRAGDDRDRNRLRSELLEQDVAALVADVHVEEHDVDSGHLRPSLVDRAGLAHLVAAELEIHPAEQPNRWFVVDDENNLSRLPRRHGAAVYWQAVPPPSARPLLS